MTEDRRLKVFLCHSKDDKDKVKKLYRRLVADSFDAWLDEVKLMPGQDWDLEIQKAVRNSDTVVVCLSNSSTTKEGYIQKEIRFALDIADEKPEGTIFLVPVRLEDCTVPNRISRFQWVDLFQKTGYSKLRESLHFRMADLNIRFNSNDVLPKTNKEMIRIPILGQLARNLSIPKFISDATGPTHTAENSIDIALSLIPLKGKGANLFALEVQGDSMADTMLNHGDIVIMKPTTIAKNGELVAVWLPRANETILRYFFEEKHRYRLQPANPETKPIFLRKDEQFEIKGNVIMVIRKVDKIR